MDQTIDETDEAAETLVRIPPKLIPVFKGNARYRGAFGGRGSAKTRTFAKMAAIWGYMAWMDGSEGIILCAREYMNSLDDSSMEEVKAAIRSEDWLAEFYEVGEKFIRSRDGRIRFAFAGLRHNLDSLKSKTRILLMWVDEGENVSEIAWQKAIPTVREDGSEIWVTWNPEDEKSPTNLRFRVDPPDSAKIIEMNWRDNPWFPGVLDGERLADKSRRPDEYGHIWEGDFRKMSKARVFRNWSIGDIETPANIVWFYGVDWGFSVDPLAGVRFCFPDPGTLYISDEVYEVGVPTERIPTVLDGLPGIRKWPSVADSARPETIDYVKRHGFPRMRGATKGKGSVEDGISFLQGFDIVISPRCPNMAEEARRYAYKVDRQTNEILPVVEDAWNHLWDSARYGSERLHRKGKFVPAAVKEEPDRPTDYGGGYENADNWKTA